MTRGANPNPWDNSPLKYSGFSLNFLEGEEKKRDPNMTQKKIRRILNYSLRLDHCRDRLMFFSVSIVLETDIVKTPRPPIL